MKKNNNEMKNFCELSENELFEINAGGLGLCIVGVVGGAITGALSGAKMTAPFIKAGGIIGGIGGAITGGLEGWKKE